jgi:hypothetical protein
MDHTDIELHLRSASDAIMVLVGELEQLEGHKRGIQPADPRFGQLATAVREAAQSLAELARDEEDWGRSARLSDPRVASIEHSSSPQPLPAILAKWRDIERRLETAEPGSADATALFAEFQRVRDEYLAAFRERASSKPPNEA